jgi:preprotein translocase subunit SecF
MSFESKKIPNIDFLGKARIAVLATLVLLLVSLSSFFTKGLNLGIDFTGGTLVEVGFGEAVDLAKVRDALIGAEFQGATAQSFGTAEEVLIRLPITSSDASAEVGDRVLQTLPNAEMRRVEFVGPQVGQELTEDGFLALLYAFSGILIYVMIRFTFKFAVGAIAAVIHDVVITVGIFSVTGMSFDLTVLAAVLAVIGYSLNDTIVVYDRVRENFRRYRDKDAKSVVNLSVNQTLSRTLVTSGTTLFVVMALFFLGGELIHGFATALIIGILVGTYSSIYVASLSLLALRVTGLDLMPVSKEDGQIDKRP